VEGGAVVPLPDLGNAFTPGSWGDDGAIYVGVRGKGLVRIRDGGGAPETVAALGPGDAMMAFPQILPGGKALLFSAYTAVSSDAASIQVMTLADHHRKTVSRGGTSPRYLATPNGTFRTVDISKSGDPFAFHQHIVSSLEKMCGELKREWHLAGSDLEHFASRGAYYLGELNAIHPFREGNGRTQREFIRELGLQSGLMLDWSQVSREEMIEASRRSLRVDNAGLEQILKKVLDNEPNRQRGLNHGQGGIERGK
jgi:prophage maintenance system killer protein